MNNFITRVNNILEYCEHKRMLIEMPIGIQSKDVWVSALLNRLVYNRADTPQGIRDGKRLNLASVSETEPYDGDRQYFDALAHSIAFKINKVISSLETTATKHYILENLDSILASAGYTDSSVTQQLKDNIVLGLQGKGDQDEIVFNKNFFVDIPIKMVGEQIFDDIFAENEDQTAISSHDTDQETTAPDYISYPNKREEYDSLVVTHLRTILPIVARNIGVKYSENKNLLNWTTRLIVLTNSEIVSSFPFQHTGMARGTKDTGLSLAQRLAIASETSNKGIKKNLNAIDKFNTTAFKFTDNVANLKQQDLELFNQLKSGVSTPQHFEGSEIKRVNRQSSILPDNVSLIAFIDKLKKLGAVEEVSAEQTPSKKSASSTFLSDLF